MSINLICCAMVIQNEIAQGFSQKQIALTYAMAMRSEFAGADQPDWSAINTAIVNRWSLSGLERVKKRAHDLVTGKIQP